MNKLLAVSAVIFMVASPVVLAFQKENTSYVIENAWLADSSLYVLYKTKKTVIHYSFSDIEGTVLQEKDTYFYQEIDKTWIENGYEIDLRKGVPADGLIYVDKDFKLVAGKSGIKASIGASQVVLDCNREIWGESNPVRTGNKLFYCGNIISTPEGAVKRLPATLEESIRQFAMERNVLVGKGSRVASCSSNGKELNIFVVDSGQRGGNLDFLKLNLEALQAPAEVGKLPFHSKEYRIANNYLGHADEGILVESRRGEPGLFEFFVCGRENCVKVTHSSYVPYLLVDTVESSVILFDQDNLASPKITFTRIQFPAKSMGSDSIDSH